MKIAMKMQPQMKKKFANLKGDMNMNKKFESICRMSQKALKGYVATQLKKTHKGVNVGDGYVFAKGDFPVLLVAHLDTVHENLPTTIVYDTLDGSLSSPNGIGGDDRCGVYMILEIIKHYNCSVLFCEDEEIGGKGATKFTKTELAKELSFNYALEFDRKGSNDAVFYSCDNKDFEQFITKDFYKTSYGSFSDISVLAPFLGCAAVNLSCGYYMAHTNSEYVVLSEMEKSIEAACDILERTTESDKFEYVEMSYRDFYRDYYYYYGYGGYGMGYGRSYTKTYTTATEIEEDVDDDYGYATYYFLIELFDGKQTQWFETFALSEDEAVGLCLKQYPDLTYNSIIDICKERM